MINSRLIDSEDQYRYSPREERIKQYYRAFAALIKACQKGITDISRGEETLVTLIRVIYLEQEDESLFYIMHRVVGDVYRRIGAIPARRKGYINTRNSLLKIEELRARLVT